MEKRAGRETMRVESIIIERDASISIHDGERASILIKPAGRSLKAEILVGRGCEVEILSIIDSYCILHLTNHVGAGSAVRNHGLWLDGGKGRLANELEGFGSEAHDTQIFIGKGDGRLELDSRLHHISQETKGDIMVRGIVRDSASVDLSGLIKIEKTGSGAKSFLSEHAILLSPDAHASANPELEIDNNDVSSRHSASISKMDERKIFYLMSRGLPRKDAKNLIVEGFLGSGLERVFDPKMREELSGMMLKAL
jgi:Fe-S cluster assembly scaffold protein SufB